MSSTSLYWRGKKNALARKNPQLDVLVGEAEEGLEAYGAFLVLRPLLLPLSSFLLTLVLLEESIPAPFTRPICTLESFIQTEVTLGLCAAETTFKRPQALRLGVTLLMKCLGFFYSTWKFKRTCHNPAPALLSHVCVLNQSVTTEEFTDGLGWGFPYYRHPLQNHRKFSRSLAPAIAPWKESVSFAVYQRVLEAWCLISAPGTYQCFPLCFMVILVF